MRSEGYPRADPVLIPMSRVGFSLYLVTDRKQTSGRPLLEVVAECLDAGVRAVQLREKDLTTRELFGLGTELRELTRRYGTALLINDRIDVALALDADGVHLPGHSFPAESARKIVGPKMLIGASVHNVTEAEEAEAGGADFIVFGPIFETPSKRPYGPPQGLDALRAVRQTVSLPLFAIGGITPGRVRAVKEAGADGVAAISALLGAPHPGRATRDFLKELEARP